MVTVVVPLKPLMVVALNETTRPAGSVPADSTMEEL